MNEAEQGILILVVVTVLASATFHYLFSRKNLFLRYVLVSLSAAIIANIIFQAVDYIQQGHLNKFGLVAFFVGTSYSVVIALVVGIPFWLYRRGLS